MEFNTRTRTVVRGAGDGLPLTGNSGVAIDLHGQIYGIEAGACVIQSAGRARVFRECGVGGLLDAGHVEHRGVGEAAGKGDDSRFAQQLEQLADGGGFRGVEAGGKLGGQGEDLWRRNGVLNLRFKFGYAAANARGCIVAAGQRAPALSRVSGTASGRELGMRIVLSSSAAIRLEAAHQFILAAPPAAEVLVVGAT